MSTMLEQAVVDAEALREAAIKNAEAAVIEKYSDQIKEVVETLLEAPEDEEMALDDIEADVDPPVDIPTAALDGEEACPCPDEDEEVDVVFDLDDLIARAEDEEPDPGEVETRGDLTDELGDLEEPLMEMDIDALEMMDIFEELTVDVSPTKSGWPGVSEEKIEEAEEELLAKQQDTKEKEKQADIRKAVQELENLQESNSKLKEDNDKLHNIVAVLKEKMDDLALSNARLLYTNRILVDRSLNERQKLRIAENLSKAKTVEEAKVIFETLQNAVGSTIKKQPKSLSEAVNRKPSSSMLPRRNSSNENKVDPVANRWKTLAGIN